MEEVTLDKDSWTYSFRPKNTMTPRTAEGISLTPGAFEVWDAGQFTPKSAGEKLWKADEQVN